MESPRKTNIKQIITKIITCNNTNGLPWWLSSKESTHQCRRCGFNPWDCNTQNLGLRSKEEKPRDPINQPSRCNTQEGLLSFAQTGDSDLLGGRALRTANWVCFICSMLHRGYKVIGYTFAKQSYWYKLHWLHVYKAILLAQTARAFVQT